MDSRWDRRIVLWPWSPEKVSDDIKKAITIGAILCVVGAVLGLLLSGSLRGLLAGATGFLPAISGLGAANRSNRRVAESVGTIREGLDDGTGDIERSLDAIERSLEYTESAQRGIRESVAALRAAAKPVGPPVNPNSSDLGGDHDSALP